MRVFGSIIVSWSPWAWGVAPLLAVALVLLVWSYRRAPQVSLAQRIAFGVKLLGILVLSLCLLEPLWSGRRAKSGANLFVVVADNSAGMTVRDRNAARSRGEILQAALRVDEADWLGTLAENFQVRQYVFDSRLRRTTDFSELTFDGKASAIGTTLRTLAERYRGRPVAGVLLMTDGNATDLGEQFYDLSDVPPVYPVVIGQGRPQKDIALTNVSVSQTPFEDAPVTIQADVAAAGFAGRTVAIDLMDQTGRLVERQSWPVRKSDEEQVFRFRLRPDKTGVLFYRLGAAEMPEQESAVLTDVPSEATLANNGRTVVVDRGKNPYRVLYVTGRPNWEYKFLRRAISEDEQVLLTGLIRVARREPKYDWRGRAGESSNPLYRGFDPAEAEQTEQYDQPVLVRVFPVGHTDLTALRDGFPETAETLFDYHAVVLDDVEAGFFSQDQMDLMRRFVAERGGGFLMLGGKESFREGNYDRTPIGRMLPVYLDRVPANAAGGAIRLMLTRDGWLQPWARLHDNEQDELQRLVRMPDFRVLNRLGAPKAGARVIATVGDEQTQQFPALVTQRFGHGRTATLSVGDVWRWGLQDPDVREDRDKFWRQTLRWLVADVPDRISLQAAHKPEQANQPVVLQVRARDRGFEPLDNVSVVIEVREPEGRTVQLTAEPALTEGGLFEATYVPRFSGGFFAEAAVTDLDGAERGRAETGWAADLEAREFESIKTNRALLEKIAGQTGGQVVALDALNGFAKGLPSRNVPVTTVWIKPLWDLPGILPVLFLLVLVCFVTEWALRRWRGMP